jgi:hypothetical protein
MGSPAYRENYLAAVQVAHSQLDDIIREFDSLQLRKEQIECVVGALQPFLRMAPQASYEVHQPGSVRNEVRQPEPIYAEPTRVAPHPEVAQPAIHAVPERAAEPTAAFSPVSETSLDPLQNRINRALGLAVA